MELAPGTNIDPGVSTVEMHGVFTEENSSKVIAGDVNDDKNMCLVDSAGEDTIGGDIDGEAIDPDGGGEHTARVVTVGNVVGV